jgi:hypothetical protein
LAYAKTVDNLSGSCHLRRRASSVINMLMKNSSADTVDAEIVDANASAASKMGKIPQRTL